MISWLTWPEWQASSDIAHVIFPSGYIFGFVVPPLHGGSSVAFTQGPDSNTKGQVVTEYSISRTPGIIDPNGGTYYYKSVPGQNYNGVTINLTGSAMPWADPGQGTWYINIRWTQPQGQPTGYSLQWAAAS